MNQQPSIGEQIKHARRLNNFSQDELAHKCNLNIRTIQRIENNEVSPRPYTIRIIEDVLQINLLDLDSAESKQIQKYRNTFEKRKQIRLFTFIFAIFLLLSALMLIISGIPKLYWAPFIYLLFFADLLVIGITWRCPGCNGLLGDAFNTRYCSRCGLKFSEDSSS